MERLTYMGERGWEIKGTDGNPCDEVCENRFLSGCHDCPIQTALDRLAAYEDTGLEPDEITTEPYGCVFYCNRKCNLDGDFCAEGPGCPWEIDEEAAKHILELTRAEKDGRLVVLGEPRKPLVWGDDAHATILCPNCNHDLMGGFQEDEYCEKDMYQCPYCGQSIDSAKEMTREEAEAKLKKRENGENEAVR